MIIENYYENFLSHLVFWRPGLGSTHLGKLATNHNNPTHTSQKLRLKRQPTRKVESTHTKWELTHISDALVWKCFPHHGQRLGPETGRHPQKEEKENKSNEDGVRKAVPWGGGSFFIQRQDIECESFSLCQL